MNELGAEGLGEAFPLQGLLVRIHGKGDIHRDHESEVDLGFSLRLGRRGQKPPQADKCCGKAGEAGTNHRILLYGSRIGWESVPASGSKARLLLDQRGA
jgi:hypothetical protein